MRLDGWNTLVIEESDAVKEKFKLMIAYFNSLLDDLSPMETVMLVALCQKMFSCIASDIIEILEGAKADDARFLRSISNETIDIS